MTLNNKWEGMSEANWSLIVHRLDTIVKGQDEFKEQLKDINDKVSKIEPINNIVDNLSGWKKDVDGVMSVTEMKTLVDWKSKIDNVVSPSQLEKKLEELDKLKTFKTQAITIWLVVQAIVFLLYAFKDLITIFHK